MPDVGLLTPGADLAPGSPAAVTDDVAVLRAMLAAEAAWVHAQARRGVVPAAAGSVVDQAVVALASDDAAALALATDVARSAAGAGNPVIPLLARLREAVAEAAESGESGEAADSAADGAGGGGTVRGSGAADGGAGSGADGRVPTARVVAAVHAGLTSQDVLDTALVLVLGDAARAVDSALARAVGAAAGLARRYRDLPALGRTLTQPAVPTTLGARCAGWLQAVAESRAAIAAAAAALPLAYGGAAGTLAGTAALVEPVETPVSAEPVETPSIDAVETTPQPHAESAPEPAAAGVAALVDAWAAELGLQVTAGPWHVTRFPVLRAASALGEVCAALGTVAADVLVGARAEVGELREPAAPGRGGSSAMAHKRNPVLSVLVRRSALAAPALLAQVASSAGQAVDERPDGAWHAEWPALQQLARHAVAASHAAAELLEGLEIDADAVVRNLHDHLGVGPGPAGTGDEEPSDEEAGGAPAAAAVAVDVGMASAVVDRVLDRYAAVPPTHPTERARGAR